MNAKNVVWGTFVTILLITFGAAAHAAQPVSSPCKTGKEFRQFDFWVGEWDVTWNGKKAGTSSVQLILDDCVIFENWTGAGGSIGKSFNLYDTNTRQWQQHWVDNSGSAIDFVGSYQDGQMRYQSATPQSDGTKVLGRMTFFKLPEGNVRQLWEQSSDNGKTWTVAFDGLYTPRKKE